MSNSTNLKTKSTSELYLRDKKRYLHTIVDARCDDKLEGLPKCPKQCEKCFLYYEEKIIEK